MMPIVIVMLVSCKFQPMVIVSPQREPVGLKQLGRSLRELDYIAGDPFGNFTFFPDTEGTRCYSDFKNVSQYKKCSYINPFQGNIPILYPPKKTSEIIGFLMFSAGVQRKHCPETDEAYRKKK